MQFNQKRLIICFTLLLIQAFSVLSAPLTTTSDSGKKRSYTDPEEIPSDVYFIKPSHWGDEVYAYVYTDYVSDHNYGVPLDEWPGKKMFYHEEEDKYFVEFPYKYTNFNSYIIFTDGKNQVPGTMQKGFILVDNALYDEHGLQGYCGEFDETIKKYSCKKNYAYIFYNKDPSWKHVFIHYKIGNGDWTKAPGEEIYRYEIFQNYYHLILNLGKDEEMTLVFTDGEGHWDNNNGKNYKLKAMETKLFGKV